MTAKDFAAAVGMSASYLSDIENGRRPISNQTLRKIASFKRLPEHEMRGLLRRYADSAKQFGTPEVAEEESSPRINEESAPRVFISHRAPDEDDFASLATWLVERMERNEAFDLIQELTEDARNGDDLATGRARTLLLILAHHQSHESHHHPDRPDHGTEQRPGR